MPLCPLPSPKTARIGRRSGNVAFDAAEYGTALLWLDAQDAATITTVGSRVSQWTSKGTVTTSFTQGTDSARPVYGATAFKASLPGLVFDTLSGLLTTDTVSAPSEYTVFFVLDADSFLPLNYWFDSSAGRLTFGGIGSGTPSHSDGVIRASDAATIANNLFTFVLKTGDATHYVDGEVNGNGTGLGYVPRGISGNTVLGGVNTNPANNDFLGTMSEVIIYSGVLTSETVDAVNAALQEKWGLA